MCLPTGERGWKGDWMDFCQCWWVHSSPVVSTTQQVALICIPRELTSSCSRLSLFLNNGCRWKSVRSPQCCEGLDFTRWMHKASRERPFFTKMLTVYYRCTITSVRILCTYMKWWTVYIKIRSPSSADQDTNCKSFFFRLTTMTLPPKTFLPIFTSITVVPYFPTLSSSLEAW